LTTGKAGLAVAPAFFHEKESLAKKANRRAAPLSRLDRFIFFEKLCSRYWLMPSVGRSTHGCEAVAAERAVRMRMYFASIYMRAKPTQQMLRG